MEYLGCFVDDMPHIVEDIFSSLSRVQPWNVGMEGTT